MTRRTAKRIEAWAVVYADVGTCLYETKAKALTDSSEDASAPVHLIEADPHAARVVKAAKRWLNDRESTIFTDLEEQLAEAVEALLQSRKKR